MRFSLKEKVRVKLTDKIGTVKSYEIKGRIINNKETEVITYCVEMKDSYYDDYFEEKDLESMTYKFEKPFELGLLDLLTDIYLTHRKLDMVKKLHTEKQQYLR